MTIVAASESLDTGAVTTFPFTTSADASASLRRSFNRLWSDLAPVGRDPRTGGYNRLAFTGVDLALREWFVGEAEARGLQVEVDQNGNQWAWWGTPEAHSVVTGSHLDSVPGGGAFDGPLGVVSSFLAVDALRAAGVAPRRSLAIVNFIEEEGSRFGLACLGSRLLTGAIDAERARGLTDANGCSFADTLKAAGISPLGLGADPEQLARVGVFVELHVEQGRYLMHGGASVGVASSIQPHGRWHFCFCGEGNHAGTTALADRHDPLLPFAEVVSAARHIALEHGAVSTCGRVRVDPNGTNVIATAVDAWFDTRGPTAESVTRVMDDLTRAGTAASDQHGVQLKVTQESSSPPVVFNVPLRDHLVQSLQVAGIDVPILATAAGHDAGILASTVPTAMLFVRNPTGISHSPNEFAAESDCIDGVVALATVLTSLLTARELPARMPVAS
ncbi:allantoate amidohydrolase [Cryobacterium sp. CG_9.6]|uniref:allantoate amidohydrolase n=1 Tax=Cryobacterium sp. CG_9.6 TaxID=2760710 RepID=UPI0024760E7F|nr:allantoate amidohydrolase [Cryobacterium sp. CG_9.6]MDH6235820.1 N-carbamoyl-L-amino-acid hydrolase [Cryobacterium sp. CG_9.6]